MAIFKVSERIPIELAKSRPLYLGALLYLGFENAQVFKSSFDRTTVNYYQLARAAIEAMGVDDQLLFTKLDVSIWRSGEDVNLVNAFLIKSSLDYDSLIRAIVRNHCATKEDWTTLVFLALTFGWDAILASQSMSRFIVMTHDSELMASSQETMDQLQSVFW